MTIGIGYLPKCKKPCLYYYKDPTSIIKLATFMSEKQAEDFVKIMDKGIAEIRVSNLLRQRLGGEE